MPRSGLDLEGMISVAVDFTCNVSPGRTGARHRISSRPGEPSDAVSMMPVE